MSIYNKDEIKNNLTLNDIYNFLVEWNADPEFVNSGIISKTICHNNPLNDFASKKLYFYKNSNLFHCYTGCDEPNFDIFDLLIKVAKLQWGKEFTLRDAIKYIAIRLGYTNRVEEINLTKDKLVDWQYLSNYERIQGLTVKDYSVTLKEYDDDILTRFNYEIKLAPWLQEDIAQEVLIQNRIGFYPGGDQITIPHFDKDGRFVGLRGRTLCASDGERFGKYRPLKINGVLYNHPLGMNLYNFNNSKDKIRLMKKAIVFEGKR